MASIFEQYGIKEVADVTFYELDTLGRQKPVLYIDTAKMSTIEKTASTSEARGGKANPALISWDFGTEINVSLEDALFSAKSMAIMQGSGSVKTGSADSPVYINVTNEAATLTKTTIDSTPTGVLTFKHKPVANSIYIYYIDDNGRWVDGQQLHNWYADSSDTTGKTYKCVDSNYLPDGSSADVVLFYKTAVTSDAAQVIEISADTFPGTYRVVGDTYARNRSTGKDEYFQFVIHRAKMQAENTITLSADGDPSTFNMSLKVLRNIKDSGMIDLIKYNFDDESAVETADLASDEEPGETLAAMRVKLLELENAYLRATAMTNATSGTWGVANAGDLSTYTYAGTTEKATFRSTFSSLTNSYSTYEDLKEAAETAMNTVPFVSGTTYTSLSTVLAGINSAYSAVENAYAAMLTTPVE